MKCIQVHEFGGPEVLKEEEVPIPTPKDGEVLVRVMSAGVNPYDAMVRTGEFGPQEMPYTPGGDAAGVVEQIGTGVSQFKPGDRVYTSGTLSGSYAQFTIAIPKYISHLSTDLTFAQGAAIGVPYSTAYKALHMRAQAKPGETVLVHGGSGAVGIAAIQAAKASGLKVLATAGSDEGMELVLRVGADAAFCHRHEDYCSKIKEYTQEKGVDVILEMRADTNLHRDLDILAFRGRVVIVGNASPGDAKFNPLSAMLNEVSIMGMALMMVIDEEWDSIRSNVEAGQRSGWVRPVVDREYALGDAAQAHHDIAHTSGRRGKLTLAPWK